MDLVSKYRKLQKREQIGLDLVEKVKARQRQNAIKSSASSGLTGNDRTPRSQRIAEKIVKRTQKGLDMQLRASYNSPLVRMSPSLPNGPATPSIHKSTPKQINHLHTPLTNQRPSLTDNLLNI
jgi:hypothetical protein